MANLTVLNACLDRTISTLTISNGRVVSIEAQRRSAGSAPFNRAVLDADGATILPGLHDRHIHLFALAAASTSLDCRPEVLGSDRSRPGGLARALQGAALTDGWVRGTGYFETVHGELNRSALDALRHDVPVRIQHRSGVAWFMNSAGLERLGLGNGERPPDGVEIDDRGQPTGRLFRLDDWIATRLGRRSIDLAPTSRSLASFGVTAVTDATPYGTASELASLVEQRTNGAILQHLRTMGAPSIPALAGLDRCAAKVVLDEATIGSLDELSEQIHAAHVLGLPVAIHLTDRSTLWLALAAWKDAGVRPGDRIEHGAVIDTAAIDEIAALGLAVVTNPSLAAERGDDHARDTEPDDRPHLWRCGSLIDAGIPTSAGTDAPYGDADPWKSMRAAVDRTTRSRQLVGSDRRLTPTEAFALFATTGTVHVGMRADLLVATGSASEIQDDLSSARVVNTIVDGRIVWSR